MLFVGVIILFEEVVVGSGLDIDVGLGVDVGRGGGCLESLFGTEMTGDEGFANTIGFFGIGGFWPVLGITALGFDGGGVSCEFKVTEGC